jgi:hypothetical protein
MIHSGYPGPGTALGVSEGENLGPGSTGADLDPQSMGAILALKSSRNRCELSLLEYEATGARLKGMSVETGMIGKTCYLSLGVLT